MRKLNLAFILPVVQVVIALFLLTRANQFDSYLGNTRAFCFAINAPIMVLLAPFFHFAPIHWMPGSILGLRSDNLVILAAVAMLWCVVGIYFDNLRQGRTTLGVRSIGGAFFNCLVFAWGLWLFFRVGLSWLLQTDSEGSHALYSVVDGLIAIAWSLVVMVVPARRILDVIRHRSPKPAAI